MLKLFLLLRLGRVFGLVDKGVDMSDIVELLRKWGAVKTGEFLPQDLIDELMPHGENGNWGPALSKLLNEAADEIEKLRRHLRVGLGPWQ